MGGYVRSSLELGLTFFSWVGMGDMRGCGRETMGIGKLACRRGVFRIGPWVGRYVRFVCWVRS